ncbi:MAG: tetratricopeptide repeat protein [Thermoplasmata archaeon]
MAPLCSSQDKILLHLQRYGDQKTNTTVPYSLCQRGIGDRVELSRSRVSRYLNQLIGKEFAKETIKHVVGLKRKRKVYFLTDKGFTYANGLREELEDQKIHLKTASGEKKVQLGEIGTYIDSKDPLLIALNLEMDGEVDLTYLEEEKKDIFVGRKEEIRTIKELIKEAKDSEPNTCIIKGDAGIGKTSLIFQLKEHATKRGFNFLYGKAYYDSTEPYSLFERAFDDLQESLPALQITSETSSSGLQGDKVLLSFDKKIDVDDEKNLKRQQRNVYLQALDKMLYHSKKTPLLLFLDDLQWADKASLELLHFLSDNLEEARVLIIGAYRPEDITRKDHLTESLRRMSREKLFKTIELKPLDWEDTKKILQYAVNRKEIPVYFIDLVYEISEGNPLFIKEIVDHLMEKDVIVPKDNKYPKSHDKIDLPRIVTDLIERRIDGLEKDSKKILQVGSVIGEKMYYPILKNMVDMDDIDLIECIDSLLDVNLWSEDLDENNFQFYHKLIHVTTYGSIPTVLRTNLHKKVLSEMEMLFENELERYYGELAHHSKRGGLIDKAISYYVKAGDHGKGIFAHEDAVKSYQEALDLIGQVKDGDSEKEERWLKLNEDIGDTYKVMGKYESALRNYNIILEYVEGDEVGSRINRKIGAIHSLKGDFDTALDFFDTGLNGLEGSTLEKCILLGKKGWALMKKGDYGRAEAIFKEQKKIAKDIGEDREIAQAYHNIGTLFSNRSKFEDAISSMERALEIWGKIDDIVGRSRTLNNLGVAYYQKGDRKKSIKYYNESMELREKMGDKQGIAAILNNIGLIYSEIGDLDRAEIFHKRSLEIDREIGDKEGIGWSLNNLGIVNYYKGRLDKALEYYKKSASIDEEIGDKRANGLVYINIGEIHRLKSNYEKALEYHKKSLDICKDLDYRGGLIYNHYGLSEVYLYLDKIESSIEHVEYGLELSRELDAKIELGIGFKFQGIINREIKEYKRADEFFNKAKKIFDDAQDLMNQGQLSYEYAVLKRLLNEYDESKRLLENSLKTFQDMGIYLWVDICEKELDSIRSA